MNDDVLNRDFLTSLHSDYQRVRENRLGGLLKVAGAHTFDAETRRHYLDAALAFDPNTMSATLHDIMGRASSCITDRASAASLYLYGGENGWWDVAPPAAERARALLATGKEQPRKDRPMKSRKSNFTNATAADDAVGLYVGISQAGIVMEACLKDPAASDESKIEAIARFFRVVGRIAPDELDASLAKASALIPAHHTNEERT